MLAKEKSLDEPFTTSDTEEAKNRAEGQDLEDDLFVGRNRTERDNRLDNLGYHCLREPRRPKHLPQQARYWHPNF